MDHTEHPPLGLRQSNLKKSFNLVIHSLLTLLTACSKEEFHKAFSAFNYAERDVLHRLFIQVITSLHRNLEEEFECICQEAQVGPTLDKIEQLVEEQSLDILFSDKTNLGDVKEEVLRVKKDEINYLMSMLDTAVEQNHLVEACIESLEKEMQESSATGDAIEKVHHLFLFPFLSQYGEKYYVVIQFYSYLKDGALLVGIFCATFAVWKLEFELWTDLIGFFGIILGVNQNMEKVYI